MPMASEQKLQTALKQKKAHKTSKLPKRLLAVTGMKRFQISGHGLMLMAQQGQTGATVLSQQR